MGAPASTQTPRPEFVSVDSSPHRGEDRELVRLGEQPHPENAAVGASVDSSPHRGENCGIERPGVKNPAHAEPSDHGDPDANSRRILDSHIDETQVVLEGASARSDSIVAIIPFTDQPTDAMRAPRAADASGDASTPQTESFAGVVICFGSPVGRSVV